MPCSGNRVGSGLHKLPYNGGNFPGVIIPGHFDSRLYGRLRASKIRDPPRSASIRLDPPRFGGELADLDHLEAAALEAAALEAAALEAAPLEAAPLEAARSPGRRQVVAWCAIVNPLMLPPCASRHGAQSYQREPWRMVRGS